jgi:hypothetical protein
MKQKRVAVDHPLWNRLRRIGTMLKGASHDRINRGTGSGNRTRWKEPAARRKTAEFRRLVKAVRELEPEPR